MKRVILLVFVMGSVALFSSCATRKAAQRASAPVYVPPPPVSLGAPLSEFWPLVFKSGTTICTVFEPQSDSWDGHEVTARSAVGIQPAGQAQPTYGVITFSAITLVDKTAHTATLAAVKIASVDFPTARGQTEDYLALLRQEFPRHAPPLPLERSGGQPDPGRATSEGQCPQQQSAENHHCHPAGGAGLY